MKKLLLFLLLLPSFVQAQKVSDLPMATHPLVGTEKLSLVQGGQSRQTTASQIANLTPLPAAGHALLYSGSTLRVDTTVVGTKAWIDAVIATQPLPLWSQIQSKPSSFPPSAHTHTLADLTQSGAISGQVPQWNGSAWVPVTGSGGGGGSSTFVGLSDAATADIPGTNTPTAAALATKAPLASPAFTGTPTAPTAAVGTNTTQLATTAHVKATADTKVDRPDARARVFDVRDYGIVIDDISEKAANSTRWTTLCNDVIAYKGASEILFPWVGQYWGEFLVPNVSHSNVDTAKWFVITIRGSGAAVPMIGSVPFAVIKNNRATTILINNDADPTLSAGPTSLSSAVYMRLENIEVQNTGTGDAVNFRAAALAYVNNVHISKGTFSAGIVPPTSGGSGLAMPPASNGGVNWVPFVSVCGYNIGIELGEHFVGTHIIVYDCNIGLYNPGNAHANIIIRYQHGNNVHAVFYGNGPYGIDAAHPNGVSMLSIMQMDGEVGNMPTNNDIDNSYGSAVGNIYWQNARGGFGPHQLFVAHNIVSDELRLARIGDIFRDRTDGPLLPSATRYVPTSNVVKWGETLNRGMWMSYNKFADLGPNSTTTEALLSGTDGWIAQQYRTGAAGSFVGFRTGSAPFIGFMINTSGVIIVYDNITAVNTAVTATSGAFYRFARTSGAWTIDRAEDGSGGAWTSGAVTWTTVYSATTVSGGSGDYTPIMVQGIDTSPRYTGSVYFPQGSM